MKLGLRVIYIASVFAITSGCAKPIVGPLTSPITPDPVTPMTLPDTTDQSVDDVNVKRNQCVPGRCDWPRNKLKQSIVSGYSLRRH